MANAEKSKSRKGYSTIAIFIFLFTHACNFLGDGFGLSRAKDVYDRYNGNMSYTEIPARITVQSIHEKPSETYSWEVLQFGCNLSGQQEIMAEVHAAGIPKEQIQTIFYEHGRFDAPLEVGKTYLVKLDIHANYYSFLFKHHYGFGIFNWTELSEIENEPAIEKYSGWKWKFVLYAFACWMQIGLFIAAIFFALNSRGDARTQKRFSAALCALFLLATCWICYVDSSHMKNFYDNFVQMIALGVGLSTLGISLVSLRKPDLE